MVSGKNKIFELKSDIIKIYTLYKSRVFIQLNSNHVLLTETNKTAEEEEKEDTCNYEMS